MIVTADCLDHLRTLPDDSIESCVTDPPYGLGAPPPIEDVLRAWLAGEVYRPKGRGFMGKAWDAFVPGPEVWREVHRVLRPGSHLLAFFGTRTFDVGVLAIRLAGFEIRDEIAWLYGSGFPKSLDVSKAIDKQRDDSPDVRKVCRWLRARMEEAGATSKTIAERFGFHPRMVDHWAARDTDSQPTLPTLEQWDNLRDLLGFGDELDPEVLRLNLRKGEPGEAWKDRPVVGKVQEWCNRTNYAMTSRDGLERAPAATPEAARWEGWGTALKPAHEPIVVARKPFRGTVAQNVISHGTGAYNVGACRITASREDHDRRAAWASKYHGRDYAKGSIASPASTRGAHCTPPHDGGRWPANVALDEGAAEMLDAQTGRLAGRGNKGPSRRVNAPRRVYGMDTSEGDCGGRFTYDAGGGASRFFYVAKASKAERDAGLEGPEVPRFQGGIGGASIPLKGSPMPTAKNAHPTVKPVALMRWLVRLVTPPGGTVLDPFAGSGTTGVAAALEGLGFLGVEREAEYAEIARARIAGACGPTAGVLDPGACDSSDSSETE